MKRSTEITPGVLIWLSRLGFVYLFCFSIVIYFTALCVINPSLAEGNNFSAIVYHLLATYFFLGLFCNCCLLYWENSFIRKEETDAICCYPDDGIWVNCRKCNIRAPPRTHHCILCQKCVLVREHHCFFTGFCIGQRNLRYYLAFCYYCAVGCAYASLLMVTYLSKLYVSPFSWSIFHFFLPLTFFEALLGYQTWGFVFFVLLGYITASGFLGAGIAFVWHLWFALVGKTSYEYHTGLPGYSKSYLKNLKLVFGEFWLLNFVSPIPLIGNRYSALNVKLI